MSGKLQGTRPSVPEFKRVADGARRRVNSGERRNFLHLLEDGNLADSNVEFIITTAVEEDDGEAAALGMLLLHMTRSQRERVAHWWIVG